METLEISRPQHSWPKLSVWVDKLIMRIYCKFLLWLTTFQLVLWHKLSQHCWQSWPGNVCLWVPRNAPWWATCGKLHYSSLTRGRRPTITHVRHAQTHTHTLLISSSVSSSSHQPSPRWLSPPPPPPPPEPSQQSCQADSSKLRGKWVSLALQSRRTDSISTIWNWARGAESGRQRRVPLSEGEGEFRRRH